MQLWVLVIITAAFVAGFAVACLLRSARPLRKLTAASGGRELRRRTADSRRRDPERFQDMTMRTGPAERMPVTCGAKPACCAKQSYRPAKGH
jgi:hypothetical protein